MPTDPADLMGQVYDLFTSLYPTTGGSATFLAFERPGLPISADMFKENPGAGALSPALAIERLSQLANTVLLVDGDAVQHTNRAVDAQLQLVLQQAAPMSSDMAAEMEAARSPAIQAFASMVIHSLQGPSTFHPAYPSPATWYDPAASGNWTAHTIGHGAPAASTPRPAPRPVVVSPPAWRMGPAATAPVPEPTIAMTHPMAPAMPPPRPAAAPAARPMIAPAPHSMPTPAPHPVVLQPVHGVPPTPAPKPVPAFPVITPAQPVTGESLSISFEHCIVTLTRPWYPQDFLTLRDWYVPGFFAGDVSHATGAADTGLLPLLPTGFVAIRNLSIRAAWSDQDRAAAQQSAAFGPFSLQGRSFDAAGGTLTCPGIQIIGWFLTPLPVLPPNTDPALLAPPAPTPPSALDILTNPRVDSALVGGLTGLLGAAEQLLSGSSGGSSGSSPQTPAGGSS